MGGDLTPLGTTDFSSYLIKAQAAKPDVIIFLAQGDDMINALKQAVQFGLDKRVHLAGAQQELEPLEGLPPEARIGTWVFEWYWNQPGVPHVAEFVAAIKKKTGRVPTARTWFGYASTWTCALAANTAKSLDAVKMAKALQGFKLPPEIALMPNGAFYRAGQNQLNRRPVRGQRPGKGFRRPRRLVPCDASRQRYRRSGYRGGIRLQDDLARIGDCERLVHGHCGDARGAPAPPYARRHVLARPKST